MADIVPPPPPPPSFKKRASRNIRKRPATPPPAADSDHASSDDTSDEEAGVRIKRRRRQEGVTVTGEARREPQNLGKLTAYEADRTETIIANSDATKSSNWYNEINSAAEAARATARQAREAQEDEQSGAYRGAAAYSNFIQQDREAKQVGPVKAPTNVRTITVTDFAPDVCKDYKQTGFCGFGDSCKFLHAREDYKQGWQLDKEWEKDGKDQKPGAGKKKAEDDDLTEEQRMLRDIPFKCIICKEDYQRPVVTKCGHYFCEKCAMTRYMREKKKGCANCGADTGGTFNVGRKLSELLEKKRKREAEKDVEEEGT